MESIVKNRSDSQAGFSFIEILVITGVLGIIAAIALAALTSALDKSKQRATMADMRSVASAIEIYSIDHSFPPQSTGDLVLVRDDLAPYQGQRLKVLDHWGHPYYYEADAEGNYSVASFGKDGIDGADITAETRNEFERDLVLSNGRFVAAPH